MKVPPMELALASGASDEPAAGTLLAVCGLAGEAAARPAASLSPGEAVHAAFATDIVSEPDLLLLDERANHLVPSSPHRGDEEERLLRPVRLAALEGEPVRASGQDRERLVAGIRRLLGEDGGKRG